jgi:hypothetical protein
MPIYKITISRPVKWEVDFGVEADSPEAAKKLVADGVHYDERVRRISGDRYKSDGSEQGQLSEPKLIAETWPDDEDAA